MQERVALLVGAEKTIDSIRDTFCFAITEASDIRNLDFRYTSFTPEGIKYFFRPAAIIRLLQRIKQISDFPGQPSITDSKVRNCQRHVLSRFTAYHNKIVVQ